MKKIKPNNKHQQKAPMKNSTKIILYSIGGIILLAVIVLMIIESASGRITVRNESDKKLEYVKAYYVDMEGLVTEDEMLFENLENGDKSYLSMEKIDLAYRQANLEVRFKFEDHDEMFIDAGYFNDVFDGNISIRFEGSEDDKVLLKIKASAGILPSPHIICNEEHLINLAEGYVED